MKYTRYVSEVYVVGRIWQGSICAYSYSLSISDITGIRDTAAESKGSDNLEEHNRAMRDAVEDWLGSNAGDFQSIQDFRVTISTPDGFDFDSEWSTEYGEMLWCDCTSQEE